MEWRSFLELLVDRFPSEWRRHGSEVLCSCGKQRYFLDPNESVRCESCGQWIHHPSEAA